MPAFVDAIRPHVQSLREQALMGSASSPNDQPEATIGPPCSKSIESNAVAPSRPAPDCLTVVVVVSILSCL